MTAFFVSSLLDMLSICIVNNIMVERSLKSLSTQIGFTRFAFRVFTAVHAGQEGDAVVKALFN